VCLLDWIETWERPRPPHCIEDPLHGRTHRSNASPKPPSMFIVISEYEINHDCRRRAIQLHLPPPSLAPLTPICLDQGPFSRMTKTNTACVDLSRAFRFAESIHDSCHILGAVFSWVRRKISLARKVVSGFLGWQIFNRYYSTYIGQYPVNPRTEPRSRSRSRWLTRGFGQTAKPAYSSALHDESSIGWAAEVGDPELHTDHDHYPSQCLCHDI
jgi:hypothetical protein